MDTVHHESVLFSRLIDEVHKVIIGQDTILEGIVLALLCDGHILLEGVPGIAKTTIIKAFTRALGLSFKRIQFTPDLLPSDLIGTLIYNSKTQDFETKKGPIFAHFVLADEINRAPAKVQAALLEAMQEHQVTIGSQTYPLDEPFMVLATQNPVEQEGTYSLPEAQIDRFMFKLRVTYPTFQEEKKLVQSKIDVTHVQQVLSKQDILTARACVDAVYSDDKIVDYITRVVHATRTPEDYKLEHLKKYIEYGVSPRATLALYQASKAYAFLKRRNFVIPDDVKAVATGILRHRIILTYEAEASGMSTDALIKEILTVVATP
jgi:MoxR-like ATPase